MDGGRKTTLDWFRWAIARERHIPTRRLPNNIFVFNWKLTVVVFVFFPCSCSNSFKLLLSQSWSGRRVTESWWWASRDRTRCLKNGPAGKKGLSPLVRDWWAVGSFRPSDRGSGGGSGKRSHRRPPSRAAFPSCWEGRPRQQRQCEPPAGRRPHRCSAH